MMATSTVQVRSMQMETNPIWIKCAVYRSLELRFTCIFKALKCTVKRI